MCLKIILLCEERFFYDKTSQSVRNIGISFNLIMGLCQKSGANITINGEIVKVVPLKWGQGKDSQLQCFQLTSSWVPARAVQRINESSYPNWT